MRRAGERCEGGSEITQFVSSHSCERRINDERGGGKKGGRGKGHPDEGEKELGPVSSAENCGEAREKMIRNERGSVMHP